MPDPTKKYGLIGYPLGHSFSKKFYDNKFEKENIRGVLYSLYEIPDIQQFSELLLHEEVLAGVNVTIPYKVAVIDYLNELSIEARAIGAVNCVRIQRKEGKKPYLIGYNTDVYGFVQSLKPLLDPCHDRALVLGNGGAAKAVCYGLDQLGIAYRVVSRRSNREEHFLTYDEVSPQLIDSHKLIINTTPLGTYPAVNTLPTIPYDYLTKDHLLYDLVYNPEKTAFLTEGEAQGSKIKNGYEMLVLQAERNWEIWNHV